MSTQLRRWWVLPALLLALAATATGCSRGQDPAGSAPATVTVGPSSTPATTAAAAAAAAAARAAVLRAYRAFWADVQAVGRTADWQSPRLAQHATGSALQQLRARFREVQAQGWVARGTVRIDPVVVSVSGPRATVRDCVDATRYGRFDPAANRWIDPPGGQPDAERVQLVDEHGWKVAETVEAGSCAG